MKEFFSKNKTIIIAVIIILIMVLLFFLFKDDIKSLFAKKEDPSAKEDLTTTDSTPVNTNTNTNTPVYGNTEIGKKVYANTDGVQILYKSNASLFRIKNKHDFVGVIQGVTTLAGNPFYSLGTGLVVAKNKVVIK
ncbi:MAG: hypothetical protein Q7W13_14015 [Bacteroidia bacterium]|nr:hypothetical protein [Bacteroidia bacterium]